MSKIDPTLVADTDIIVEHAAHAQKDEAAKSPDNLILAITLVGVILWGLSVAAFGIPGLYIPALAAVPVIWTMLIVITRG
jgi:hypothetical protein